MRLAPAVSVTASNAGVWRWLQVLLLAASAGVGAVWMALRFGLPVGAALLVALTTAASSAAVAWRMVPAKPVQLRWTGAAWQMAVGAGAAPVDLQSADVAIDLGVALLLRLRPAAFGLRSAAACWVAVTRAEAGPDFRAFCVALYAAAPSDESPALAPDAPPAR